MMALILKSRTLCNLRYKSTFKNFPYFFRQIHHNVLIEKPVRILVFLQDKSILHHQHHFYSSNSGEPKEKMKDAATTEISAGNKLSQRARLKQAVRDYGVTIIVFHVAISLVSLGICYLAIFNGVDAIGLLHRCGFPDYVVSSKIAVGGSTFVIAYAVHKLFAPARIAITLSSAPFIVKYLRKINLIKPPPPK